MTPEILRGYPAEAYHVRELGVATNSALRELARSPYHYRAWVDEGRVDTDAMRLGRAFHAAVLEPDRYADGWEVLPDFGAMQSSINRAKRDDWIANRPPGVEVIKPGEAEKIAAMVDAIRSSADARELIEADGICEGTVRWTDELSGVPCKARFDKWIPGGGILVELKSAADVTHDAFGRAVISRRYHVQRAHYLEAVRACGHHAEWIWIAVESAPPHAVAVYTCDADGAAAGVYRRRQDLATLSRCTARDEWPAPRGVLTLPPWA